MENNQILESTNYDEFKILLGNRSVNDGHVNELIESMQENGNLKIPIIVNEKKEIIDGQHRYFAWLLRKEPITYIIKKGLGLKEAQVMNDRNRNWKDSDFLQSYLELGLPEYKKYNEFKKKYEFGHSTNLLLLIGKSDHKEVTRAFKQGTFVVRRWTEACAIADLIVEIAPYYEGYKRRSFVMACRILFKTIGFDKATLIKKLKFSQELMVDCLETTHYVELLARIYNRHNQGKRIGVIREGNKIEVVMQ